jgi:hypothetical protein
MSSLYAIGGQQVRRLLPEVFSNAGPPVGCDLQHMASAGTTNNFDFLKADIDGNTERGVKPAPI